MKENRDGSWRRMWEVGVSLKMAEKTCEGLNVVGKDPGERVIEDVQ